MPALAAQPFVSPEKEARLRQLVPVPEYANDPDIWFYTEREVPRAGQFAGPGASSTTFVWGGYNISGDPPEQAKGHGRGGHPNNYVEFPWAGPGGTDRCANVKSVKFLKLPKNLPIVYYRKRVRGDHDNNLPFTDVLAWVYPVGTKFGEVLTQRGPDGYDYAFEMRVRERLSGAWAVEIYRPFATAESLLAAVQNLPPFAGQAELVQHLSAENSLPVRTLSDRHRTSKAFSDTAAEDYLPAIDESIVRKLLTERQWEPALGESWRANCAAPTTRAGFHIVPANYEAAFLGSDQTSCKRCHESALMHADDFDRPRQWYGFVRGSDQILSFHPIEPNAISQHGAHVPPRIRQASWVEPYNPQKHPASIYHELSQ
jgi:hypothetical protein